MPTVSELTVMQPPAYVSRDTSFTRLPLTSLSSTLVRAPKAILLIRHAAVFVATLKARDGSVAWPS